MKYYIGSNCDYLAVYKEENNKFFRAVGWSNNTYSFEEIPYIPKNAMPIDSIKSNESRESLKDKKSFHKKMKNLLEEMNFTDYRLKTELDLNNNIVFVIISDPLAEERYENVSKIMDTFDTKYPDPEFENSYQIQLVSNETWNSRRY